MKFFITGASSFIGVELCRYLSDNGHHVIAMSRKENEQLNDIALNGNLQVFYADMRNLMERAIDVKADVFIHLAWAGALLGQRDNQELQEGNISFSLECVKLSKRMGCQLYADAGSQAEYGIVPGVISEDTPCNPVSAYGKAKLQMYRETCDLTKRIGLKYIHLRILSVYGENDHPNTLIMSSLRKLKNNEPIGMRSGGQKWNYVYVKDAARQIAELSTHAVSDKVFYQEVYNIASTDTRKLQDFIIAMKEIVGSESELSFGGYNPEKDVNLNPDTKKTAAIVKPLTEWKFEDIIKKMDYPKIQVFIMTYNRPDTLVTAIDSVLNQTYSNIELIVSDNSTNEETFSKLSILDSWGRYKYVRRNPPITGVEHLKIIFEEATSEYFIIFHDDDEMLSGMVEKLYYAIRQNDSFSAAGANARIIKYGKYSRTAFIMENSLLANGEALIQRYNTDTVAPFPSYMYHRKIIGNIRPDYKHKGGKYCDVSFLFDVANQGPIVYVGEPLMNYYIHKGQDSGNFDFIKHVQLTNYLRKNCVNKTLVLGLRLYHIYNNAIEGYREGTMVNRSSTMRILWKYKMKHYFFKYIIRFFQSKIHV